MAVVQVNGQKVRYQFEKGNKPKLEMAARYISDELISQAVSNATSIADSSALAKFNLYDTNYKFSRGFNMRLDIEFEYNQDNLVPAIGSDTDDYRHTSFVGEEHNPDDYRELVNSGHAGFGLPSSWNGKGGYWDTTLEQIPDIVEMGLFRAGFDLR